VKPNFLARSAAALSLGLIAGACASPGVGPARELAHERYVARDGDAEAGSETLVLRTRADFGKDLATTVERAVPWHGVLEIRAVLAPDWSIRELSATSSAPAAGGAKTTYRWSDDGSGVLLVTDSLALPIVWLRTHPLVPGAPPRVFEAIALDPAALEPTSTKLTIERLPDRGRRVAYRYRLGFGEWTELETDHRDLPYASRRGTFRVEREVAPASAPAPESAPAAGAHAH
jgi:hypothetical protein